MAKISAFTCAACNKKVIASLESKLIWNQDTNEDGEPTGLALHLAKHPENIVRPNKVKVCGPCSIEILSGLLNMECQEIKDVFSSMNQ